MTLVHIQFDSTYEASPMFYLSDKNHLYYHIMEFISNIDKIFQYRKVNHFISVQKSLTLTIHIFR